VAVESVPEHFKRLVFATCCGLRQAALREKAALAKNGLVAGAGGVTVSSAMKTLSAKVKTVELPSLK
jgi:hypothetical protein